MKTLHKQIEDLFNQDFHGHPSRSEEHDIRQLKQAVLKLAQAVDNIIHNGNY